MASQSTDALDLSALLRSANDAAEAASEVLLNRFRPSAEQALETFYKSPGSLVTDADLAADKAISDVLKSAGAPGKILSEESETSLSSSTDSTDDLTWLVDPLCGTVPFSLGMDHWGVNIALRSSGDLLLASLPLPSIGVHLSAIKGGGVYQDGKPFTSTSPGTNLSECAIGLEVDGPDEWRARLNSGLEWIPSVSQINTFASAAYPTALVCLGRLAAAVFYGIEPMHFAAGATIARELGIAVTDQTGNPIDWSKDDELPVVVFGWPSIHEQILRVMQ